MLYRAKASVLFVLPSRGPMPMIRLHPPVADHRKAEASEANEAAARGPIPRHEKPADPDRYRPRPGIDTRLRDHDPVALFSNVYRLGHASEFSMSRLMEICTW